MIGAVNCKQMYTRKLKYVFEVPVLSGEAFMFKVVLLSYRWNPEKRLISMLAPWRGVWSDSAFLLSLSLPSCLRIIGGKVLNSESMFIHKAEAELIDFWNVLIMKLFSGANDSLRAPLDHLLMSPPFYLVFYVTMSIIEGQKYTFAEYQNSMGKSSR